MRSMLDDEWLQLTHVQQCMATLRDKVVAKYRISNHDASEIIHDILGSHPSLKKVATETTNAKSLQRTRAFKQAADDAKKKIYYQLRNYRDDAAKQAITEKLSRLSRDSSAKEIQETKQHILESHISTRERLPDRETFYHQMAQCVPPPQKVLDIGSGVQPLMFPFDSQWAQQVTTYVAVDQNAWDVQCVDAYSRLDASATHLTAQQWSLSEGWGQLRESTQTDHFDLALMLKIVPVIHRQERELLQQFCEMPATHWLITGSRIAMTKRENIEKREKRVIENFLSLTGRSIKAEFEIEHEFAWLV